jgi:DNA processing protein
LKQLKMTNITENTYWIAIAHLPSWTTERTNQLLSIILKERGLSLSEYFELSPSDREVLFPMQSKEAAAMDFVQQDFPRLAFLAEQLHNEGYRLIPINSPDFPAALKSNLKVKSCPPLLYAKGKIELLHEEAVAIVGSRKAGAAALNFTDKVAAKCASEGKVVVSGYAKGVDQQAMDSALAAGGKSIIVLPQGILTFQSGFKKHYEAIVNGKLLVISTFFPKAGWEVGLAMARNAYIYGQATEIYAAESDSKGGTWEGVMDGLKRQRKIYVRQPLKGEKNANDRLIAMGAFAVDQEGNPVQSPTVYQKETVSDFGILSEEKQDFKAAKTDMLQEVLRLLQSGPLTAKELILALKMPDWDVRKLGAALKKNPQVRVVSGKPVKFARNDSILHLPV